MSLDAVLRRLDAMADPAAAAGMARYGIRSKRVLGVSAGRLQGLARELGRDHTLAQQLWATGVLDARILAALVDDPSRVTPAQMDRWARGFDNWALCDACCLHLFGRTPFAWAKARAWARREEEYVRRAGFALMAVLAVHAKDVEDARFRDLLPLIEQAAADERHAVRKGVSWALRQIGKRNPALNRAAIESAERLRAAGGPGRFVASEALRELRGAAVQGRLSAGAKGARRPARETRRRGAR